MHSLSRIALGGILAVFTGACSITRTTKTSSERNARYTFENVEAATTFYDTLIHQIAPDDGTTNHLELSLSPLDISREQHFSGAYHFNKAAALADTNGDLLITRTEALRYQASQ